MTLLYEPAKVELNNVTSNVASKFLGKLSLILFSTPLTRNRVKRNANRLFKNNYLA